MMKGKHCFEGFVLHAKDEKRERSSTPTPQLFIWKTFNLQKSCKNNTLEHMLFEHPHQVFTFGNICSLSSLFLYLCIYPF